MRKYVFGLIIVLLTALLAGYHTRADSSTESINACYSQTSGALRRVASASECRTSEVFVTWNIQGPQGVPGDSGISKVFSYSSGFNAPGSLNPWTPIVPNNTLVASLNLPAGKYSASGKVLVYSTEGVDVECILATDQFAGGFVDDALDSGPGSTTINVQGTFELTTAQIVGMWCGGHGNWRYAQLSATQVNEIESQ
jgi:hypothetical protein